MFEITLNPLQDSSIRVVRERVKPVLGCMEPISPALAAVIASSELDDTVEYIDAWASPNLMKNGTGTTVSGTGMVGLSVMAALDALGGNVRASLKVLKDTSPRAIADARMMLSTGKVAVMLREPCEDILSSRAKVYSAEGRAYVTIVGGHTNIVHIGTSKGIVFTTEQNAQEEEQESPLAILSHAPLEEILESVNAVPFKSIRFILDAVKLNGALSQEGLRGNWSLYIGVTLERQYACGLLANDLSTFILIRTSTAPDARMGGMMLPATSNFGSGNQGITVTVPVMVVVKHFGADEEKLARALMLSHPGATCIHHQLPRLSALCAVTTAVMGAAAGMTRIVDGRYNTIVMAINSMISDVSRMIYDGASNSYTMEVSISASATQKTVLMAPDDTAVTGSEGIVAYNMEQSIANLCVLACRSMQETDKQVTEIMASRVH